MRALIFALPALLALGGTAFAQQAPGQQPPAPPQAAPMAPNDMPPPPPPPGRPPHPGPHDSLFAPPPPPPPPSRAAHFRIQKGDMTLDVKCADQEPMVTCADITLQLLNRVAPAPTAAH